MRSTTLVSRLCAVAVLICLVATARASDTIYINGDILTMAGKEPTYVEALVVDGGKITFAGTKDEAMKLKTADTKVADLVGHALLPGFIDAHGHMIYYGKNLMDQNLTGVKDIPELVERMNTHAGQIPGEGWIVGMGYAPLKMSENRHPTADELDEISGDRPVLVVHASGHGGSMNHALMRLLNIG